LEIDSPNPFQNRLKEKLVESLTSSIPFGAQRRIYGAIVLPGKISAVVGIRRAGKTMFVHQVQRERLWEGMDPGGAHAVHQFRGWASDPNTFPIL